jgi:V/A-type H+-transporting ATPase subunit K
MAIEYLGNVLALTGAALAVFLSGIGSAIGLNISGNASAGVLSEKPERYGLNFIMVVLPGTQGFYGFLGGFIVLQNLGFFDDTFTIYLSWKQGLVVLAACLPVAIAGLVTAIYQGKMAASGIIMAAKKPEMAFKAGVVYAVMIEVYAILGLLASLFMINNAVDWKALTEAAKTVVGG